MLDKTLELIPAYSRRYKQKSHFVRDWKSGKDFKIKDGPYCSIVDLSEIIKKGYQTVHIEINYKTIYIIKDGKCIQL